MAGFDPVRESSASGFHHRPSRDEQHDGKDDASTEDHEEDSYRRPSRSASIVALLNPSSDEREQPRPSSSASSSYQQQRNEYDAQGAAHHHRAPSSPPLAYRRSYSRSVDQYQSASANASADASSPMSITAALHHSPALPTSRPTSSHLAYSPPSDHYHHHQHVPQQPMYSPRFMESADRSSAHSDHVDRQQHPVHAAYYDAYGQVRRPSLRMEARSVSQGSHPGSASGSAAADSPMSVHAMHSLATSPVDSSRAAHMPAGYASADSPRSRIFPGLPTSSSPHLTRPSPGGFRVPEIPAHRSPEVRRAALPPLRTSQGHRISPPLSGAPGYHEQYSYPSSAPQHPDHAGYERTPVSAFPPTPGIGSPSTAYHSNGHAYPPPGSNAEYFRAAPAHGSRGEYGAITPGGLPPTPGGRSGSIGSVHAASLYPHDAHEAYNNAHHPHGGVVVEDQHGYPTAAGVYPTYAANSRGSVAAPGQTFVYSPPVASRSAAPLRRQSQQSDGSYAEDGSIAGDERPAVETKHRRKSSGGTSGSRATGSSAGGPSTSRRSSQASWQSQEDIQAANAAAATMLSVGRKPSMHLAEDSVMYAASSTKQDTRASEANAGAKRAHNGLAINGSGQDHGHRGESPAEVPIAEAPSDGDTPMMDAPGVDTVQPASQARKTTPKAEVTGPTATTVKPDPVFPTSQSSANAKGTPETAAQDVEAANAKRKRSPSSSSATPGSTGPTSAGAGSATMGKVKTLELDEVERLAQRDSKKRKSVSSLKESGTTSVAKPALPASLPSKPDTSTSGPSPYSHPRSNAYAAVTNALPAAAAEDKEDTTIPYQPKQRVSAPNSVRRPLSRDDLIALNESMIRRGSNRLRMAWAEKEEQEGREPRDGFWEGYVEQWNKRAERFGDASTRPVKGDAPSQDEPESEVARHYNNRREVGLAGRELSPILPLKHFNNWVKSVLIGTFGTRNSKVMDMGGGKGGDLQKWVKLGIRELVLADIAATSVEQAEARYRERRCRFRASFYALDCFGQTLSQAIPPEVLSTPFDMVSLQFCMHYGWSSPQSARLVLENVSRYLAPGGTFIGTIPDSDTLYKRRDALGEDEYEFGNSKYHVRFEQKEKRKPFGDKYTFFLTDAVEDVPEYVVDWAQFESLANEYGLQLRFKKTMSEFWDEFRSHGEYESLARRMKVCDNPRYTKQPMGDDLWAATTVYCAFAFTKVASGHAE